MHADQVLTLQATPGMVEKSPEKRGPKSIPLQGRLKLRDHAGFLDYGWPVQPMDCLDRLEEVSLEQVVGSNRPKLVLRTLYNGKPRTRDFSIRNDDFAQKAAQFLRQHIGKTILEIGDLDVDF